MKSDGDAELKEDGLDELDELDECYMSEAIHMLGCHTYRAGQ